MPTPLKKVEIFTDGACKGNPGPGGYGGIIRENGNDTEYKGFANNTTNNIMEMKACIIRRPSFQKLFTLRLLPLLLHQPNQISF